jgi:transmembrane 9 superfamily protein 2/4
MAYITFISLICIVFLIQSSFTFYIPGVAPLDFKKGDIVEVKVIIIDLLENQKLNSIFKAVKMTSTKTQLPYDYYDVGVHCKPSNGTKYKSENLGI